MNAGGVGTHSRESGIRNRGALRLDFDRRLLKRPVGRPLHEVRRWVYRVTPRFALPRGARWAERCVGLPDWMAAGHRTQSCTMSTRVVPFLQVRTVV